MSRVEVEVRVGSVAKAIVHGDEVELKIHKNRLTAEDLQDIRDLIIRAESSLPGRSFGESLARSFMNGSTNGSKSKKEFVVNGNSRPKPFSYDPSKQVSPKRWTETQRRILTLRKSGKNYGELTRMLNAEGYTTKYGIPWTVQNARLVTKKLEEKKSSREVPEGEEVQEIQETEFTPPTPEVWEKTQSRIVESRKSGKMYSEIAKALNDEGVTTSTGRAWTVENLRLAVLQAMKKLEN